MSIVGGQLRVTDGTGTGDHMSVAGNASSMIVTNSRGLAPGAGSTPLSSRKVNCVNATAGSVDCGSGAGTDSQVADPATPTRQADATKNCEHVSF